MTNLTNEPLFLGPKAENATTFAELWQHLFQAVVTKRQGLFSNDPAWLGDNDTERADVLATLDTLIEVLQTEIPTFSPRYLGHMISDTSVPALLGHMAVLLENPNIASREAGTAGSQLEVEAINALAGMVGLPLPPVRGHFTSGGTVANFEAFWRARYRLDHRLALSAWLIEHGHSEADFFRLGMMGAETFAQHCARYNLSDEQLKEYSWVLKGPWAISRLYRERLSADFPEPVLLVPGNKHYSWPKCANVFGLSEEAIWSLDLDDAGRVNVASLEREVERARSANRPILMVVSVAGTTELGMVDPVDAVADRLERYRDEEGLHIWHHVDAAYGGYLCSTFRDGESALDTPAVRALQALPRVDSITLDPHKLGFVPYACGAFVVPTPEHYAVSSIKAPYLSQDREVAYPSWSTTLEGSRAATGAGAVWLSSKVLPLNARGHGAILNRSIDNTRMFYKQLAERIDNIRMVPPSDSNIVCFTIAAPGEPTSAANATASYLVDRFKDDPDFACTRTALGTSSYRALIDRMVQGWSGVVDTDHLLVVRMVIMNPYMNDAAANEHLLNKLIATIEAMLAAAD